MIPSKLASGPLQVTDTVTRAVALFKCSILRLRYIICVEKSCPQPSGTTLRLTIYSKLALWESMIFPDGPRSVVPVDSDNASGYESSLRFGG